jgi:hypothetical protein
VLLNAHVGSKIEKEAPEVVGVAVSVGEVGAVETQKDRLLCRRHFRFLAETEWIAKNSILHRWVLSFVSL